MERLETEERFAALREAETLLVVQFGAVTCAPCTAIHQKLEAWLEGHPGAAGVYIPVEDFRALAAQEGVFTVPTVFVYVEGRLTVRASGYFSLEEVLAQAERYERLLGST